MTTIADPVFSMRLWNEDHSEFILVIENEELAECISIRKNGKADDSEIILFDEDAEVLIETLQKALAFRKERAADAVRSGKE